MTCLATAEGGAALGFQDEGAQLRIYRLTVVPSLVGVRLCFLFPRRLRCVD